MSLVLLIALVVAAVAAGLVVGSFAGRSLKAASDERDEKKRSIGARVSEVSTRAVVGLWRWQRDRKKKKREQER